MDTNKFSLGNFLASFFIGKEKGEKFFLLLGSLFCGLLIISNYLSGAKMCTLFGFLIISGGTVVFPLSYVINDALGTLYDEKKVRQTIGAAALLLTLMSIFTWGVQKLPPAVFWDKQEAFESIMGQVLRVNIGSVMAVCVGIYINLYIVTKLSWMGISAPALAFRFIASTVVAEAFDTLIFLVTAFYGSMPNDMLLKAIIGQWAFKVSWEVVALFISIPLVRMLYKAEWGE